MSRVALLLLQQAEGAGDVAAARVEVVAQGVEIHKPPLP